MGVELPRPGGMTVPRVPVSLGEVSPELLEYLERLARYLNELNEGFFNNDSVTVGAINSGTSGTFTISSGGSIVVTSGVVITVTS